MPPASTMTMGIQVTWLSLSASPSVIQGAELLILFLISLGPDTLIPQTFLILLGWAPPLLIAFSLCPQQTKCSVNQQRF